MFVVFKKKVEKKNRRKREREYASSLYISLIFIADRYIILLNSLEKEKKILFYVLLSFSLPVFIIFFTDDLFYNIAKRITIQRDYINISAGIRIRKDVSNGKKIIST